MAEFLTEAWIDGLDNAVASLAIDPALRVVIQQVVPAGPDGPEVTYVMEVGGGRLRVRPGRVEDPDVTFTQDRATAGAIHRGELSAQAAFMQGRLRLGGDLHSVLERAGALAALEQVVAAGRA